MGLELEYTYGQTPLEEEEKEALLIKHITTKGELDQFEQLNIEKAVEWVISRKFRSDKVFDEGFILALHKRMFGEVWKWAGEFRKSNKNIGVDKYSIAPKLFQLNGDCRYWIEDKIFEPDRIAIEYKHRIVKIHPFANGNGRHSRLMADIIIEKLLGGHIFTWGKENLTKSSIKRLRYIDSIKKADNGDIGSLMDFARS